MAIVLDGERKAWGKGNRSIMAGAPNYGPPERRSPTRHIATTNRAGSETGAPPRRRC